MSKELDSIKRDIDAALGQGGFVVYHGLPRDDEHLSPIRWDAVNHPDPALFLKAAAELGVRLIVSSERTFSEEMLSDAQSQLETAAVPREERREMERSVRRLRGLHLFHPVVVRSWPQHVPLPGPYALV
jgi:beta-phosphoglucomutase-like phosphatase (HAD superfamily)